MQIKLTLLFLFSFALLSRIQADQPRPRFIDDYGAVFSQKAHLFPATANDVVLIHPQAIKETLPFFKDIPVGAFPGILAQLQLVYLTHLQMEWNGLLMETLADPIGSLEVDHPMKYIRGSVRFPMIQHPVTKQPIPLGVLDLKGTGLSGEGEETFRLYHSAIALVMGKTAWSHDALIEGEVIRPLRYHLDDLRVTRETLRNSLPKEGLAIRNRDKQLHENSISITLTQYLLLGLKQAKETGTAKENTRQKVIEAIRSMDYQNGLLPLDRAVKEFEMSIAWETYLARYNAVHGTHLRVNRVIAVMALPVDILLPNNERRRAGIAIREPDWRNHTNSELSKMFPGALVEPVLGGIQTGLFGDMVDLELPGLQTATDLLNWRGSHSIDREAQTATEAWLRKDANPLSTLNNKVLRIANEAAIPDKPFPTLGRLTAGTLSARRWIEKLHHINKPLAKDEIEEIRTILVDSDASGSEKAVLLNCVVIADLNAGHTLLIAQLEKLSKKLNTIKNSRRSALQGEIDVYEIIDGLSNTILRHDSSLPFTPSGDTLFNHLSELPYRIYPSLIRQLARRVYVSLAHSIGLENELAASNSRVWTATLDAILIISEFILLERRNPDLTTFNIPLSFMGRQGQEGYSALLDFIGIVRKSPGLFNLILMTAERFGGMFLSDKLIRFLDPNNESRAIDLRKVLRTQKTLITERVMNLVNAGMEHHCAVRLAVESVSSQDLQ